MLNKIKYNSQINLLIQIKSFMVNKIMSSISATIVKATTMAVILLGAFAMQTFNAHAEEELTPMEQLELRMEGAENDLSKLKKLKIDGYIQTQFQSADYQADGVNFKLQNRLNAYEAFEEANYSRFGIRRGRFKITYTDGLLEGVFQPDITQNGVSFKDVFFTVSDPWTKRCGIRAGIFDRPFGHEIAYSSRTRESPERSRIFQTLFPDERDMGVMLILRTPRDTPLDFLRIDAGMFAGNGIRPQFDGGLDFIGRLSGTKRYDNFSVGGGVSAYIGGQRMYNGLDTVRNEEGAIIGINHRPVRLMEMEDHKWVVKEADNYGKRSPRQYFGADFQFSIHNEGIGFTSFRAEYIMGNHAGGATSAPTLNPTALLTGDRYLRNISGGYFILTQDLPVLPLTFVAKYDWYNPNTDIEGDEIGKADNPNTSVADVSFNNIGLGLIWYINAGLRLTGYYDIVSHEISDNLSGYKENRSMNVFTLRLQYRF